MGKLLWGTAAAVLACSIASLSPVSAAVVITGDPVLYWNQVMLGGSFGGPPSQARAVAMVNIAVHDAVNATLGFRNHPYLRGIKTPGGDTRAAASQAARDVLVHLDPTRTAAYDVELSHSLALIPDGQAKMDGIATGAAYATAIIAQRTGDGSIPGGVSYTPSGLPGRWKPTPPTFANAGLTHWGLVDPFVMTAGNEFRPVPPPALGSPEWAAAYNEVLELGSATSAIRTADQTASAAFWNPGNGLTWLQLGLNAVEGEGLSTIENARLFGLLGVGFADSQIAGFDAKYSYDFWRPVTAIKEGDTDGNPLTIGDPNWTPLNVTPAHPSYISTLSAISAVGSTTLTSVIGAKPVCLTIGVSNRCWSSFEEAALDAASSRVWGGIHYSFDGSAGLQVGNQIAAKALAGRALQPVPEPATWAMMILGFAFVGSVVRRRRLQVRYA
jgi:hypothetical protein